MISLIRLKQQIDLFHSATKEDFAGIAVEVVEDIEPLVEWAEKARPWLEDLLVHLEEDYASPMDKQIDRVKQLLEQLSE
jgi:hypothetical protein